MTVGQYAELQSVTPPPRDTLQERVYRELRLAIMSGRFEPGRSLTIRGVAAAMGTSSMPVREALRQLAAEQALAPLANRSFGTTVLTRKRFADLLEVRMEIEGYAAGRAARLVDGAMIERLVELDAAMHVALAAGERERYISYNREFHFLIYRRAGSDILVPMIETLWLQIGPYLNYGISTEMQSGEETDRHQEILGALRAGDVEGTMTSLRDDINDAAKIIVQAALFADD